MHLGSIAAERQQHLQTASPQISCCRVGLQLLVPDPGSMHQQQPSTATFHNNVNASQVSPRYRLNIQQDTVGYIKG